MSRDFIWRDAERVVVFRRDGIEGAPELLDEHGFGRFDLLSTERALLDAPELGDAAATTHLVDPGQVPQTAAALLETARSTHLVALGGGRVIDTAKAIAAISGARVAAIPTTLSGAEMTGIHRLPAGAEDRVRGPGPAAAGDRRPRGDDQPARGDAAGERDERPRARRRLPLHAVLQPGLRVGGAAGGGADRLRARRRARRARPRRPRRGRDPLRLRDRLRPFSIHHVVCQTLVRVCGSPHAETNAAILPRAMAFMEPRAPDAIASLAEAIGCDPAAIEARILELGGDPPGLGEAGADHAARRGPRRDAAAPRARFNPQPPTKAELAEMIERAW